MLYSDVYYILKNRIFGFYNMKINRRLDLSDLFFSYILLSREVNVANRESEISREEYRLLCADLCTIFESCIARQIIPC